MKRKKNTKISIQREINELAEHKVMRNDKMKDRIGGGGDKVWGTDLGVPAASVRKSTISSKH